MNRREFIKLMSVVVGCAIAVKVIKQDKKEFEHIPMTQKAEYFMPNPADIKTHELKTDDTFPPYDTGWVEIDLSELIYSRGNGKRI